MIRNKNYWQIHNMWKQPSSSQPKGALCVYVYLSAVSLGTPENSAIQKLSIIYMYTTSVKLALLTHMVNHIEHGASSPPPPKKKKTH